MKKSAIYVLKESTISTIRAMAVMEDCSMSEIVEKAIYDYGKANENLKELIKLLEVEKNEKKH